MPGFSVTYEVWTEADIEAGETYDRGYVVEGVGLREALDHCYPQENAGRWFSEVDDRLNYRTGEREIRALHPPRAITRASYARLVRLFGLKGH